MRYITANVDNVIIGKGHPTVIQSMCNCDTDDISAAVKQCIELKKAGASLVRLTTQGLKEVDSLGKIKDELRRLGEQIPLVADVHFSPEVAIAAVGVADKVRINPGNFARDHEVARLRFKEFIKACKANGTAIRIGINHGSLGSRITELYGNTPKGMQEAMMEWLGMCIEENFFNVVLSLKASNVPVMVVAYRLLIAKMQELGYMFPLHVGVTEAGNGDMGRIKSSVGIASLLSEGIGDTIRVSLTEPPVNEIPVAKQIVKYFSHPCRPVIPSSGKPSIKLHCASKEELIVRASCIFGPLLADRKIDDFDLSADCGGTVLGKSEIDEFKDNLLQAVRRKITKCEYVACPGCGRTLYNIEKALNEVKERTSHLKGLTIAVMGCIVNGPGEMADADYGYIGEGRGKVSIFRGRTPVMRSVPQENAVDTLLGLIEADIKDGYSRACPPRLS